MKRNSIAPHLIHVVINQSLSNPSKTNTPEPHVTGKQSPDRPLTPEDGSEAAPDPGNGSEACTKEAIKKTTKTENTQVGIVIWITVR
jgi:hypothetical protein